MTELIPAGSSLPDHPDDATGTIRQMVAAWLLAQESEHTKVAYARDLMSAAPRMKVPGWLPWCAERELNPLAVRRAHIDAYKHALQQVRYSPNSISRRLAVVSSWYQYLTDEEVIDHNPAKAVKRPKIDQSISSAVGLSEAELNQLLDAAEADYKRSAALIAVLFYAGLRVGSVVAANVGDLGWNEGERTIALTVKGGSTTHRHIEEIAAEALDAYLAERGKPAKDEPLFLNVSGFRIDQAYAWRLIRQLARTAGIKSWERLGPHSLRHTMATHALDEGVPLVDVQDALGHRDPKTTRRYDRARARRDKRPGLVLAARRRKTLAQRAAEPLPRRADATDPSSLTAAELADAIETAMRTIDPDYPGGLSLLSDAALAVGLQCPQVQSAWGDFAAARQRHTHAPSEETWANVQTASRALAAELRNAEPLPQEASE